MASVSAILEIQEDSLEAQSLPRRVSCVLEDRAKRPRGCTDCKVKLSDSWKGINAKKEYADLWESVGNKQQPFFRNFFKGYVDLKATLGSSERRRLNYWKNMWKSPSMCKCIGKYCQGKCVWERQVFIQWFWAWWDFVLRIFFQWHTYLRRRILGDITNVMIMYKRSKCQGREILQRSLHQSLFVEL